MEIRELYFPFVFSCLPFYQKLYYLHFNGNNWQVEIADTIYAPSGVLKGMRIYSLKYNNSNNPCIFYEKADYAICYLEKIGSNWYWELTGGGTGNISSGEGILLNGSKPHFVFGSNWWNGYGYKVDTNWVIEGLMDSAITCASIADDKRGNVQIAFPTGKGLYWGYNQFPAVKEEKKILSHSNIFQKKLFNIYGSFIKERNLKKGIYFRRTEKGIEKVIILK